jgi:hypothetical protein
LEKLTQNYEQRLVESKKTGKIVCQENMRLIEQLKVKDKELQNWKQDLEYSKNENQICLQQMQDLVKINEMMEDEHKGCLPQKESLRNELEQKDLLMQRLQNRIKEL